MDKATLRPYVFEILKKTPQTHFHAIENDLRRLVESYERHDVLTLQEILWELLVQGVLAPGKNSLNLNLPFVHLTEYGSQCLEDGRILARDPDRYIGRLTEVTDAEIDDFVLHSVREALSVSLTGSWSSSVVLLARAAEHLFDQLANILLSTRQHGGETQELEASTRPARSRAQAVIQTLQHHSLSTDITESIEPQLNGLMALIQLSRNQDGSPRWTPLSRDQVLGFFLLFPEQCAFVYHLMNALEGEAAS
ncbi:hypothetical protein KAT84_01250 [Candidatus Bipolaricaulota bacterium]|nr:hypothetical protein [Candidatus Bipolaricaulota bacterium]